MKIFEIFGHNSEEAFAPDFDLGDDLRCFINNDPQFYRKHYFPFIIRLKEAKEKKVKFTAKAFEALVKHAYDVYKESYKDTPNLPTDLEEELVMDICENLYREEIKNIEEGVYNDIS